MSAAAAAITTDVEVVSCSFMVGIGPRREREDTESQYIFDLVYSYKYVKPGESVHSALMYMLDFLRDRMHPVESERENFNNYITTTARCQVAGVDPSRKVMEYVENRVIPLYLHDEFAPYELDAAYHEFRNTQESEVDSPTKTKLARELYRIWKDMLYRYATNDSLRWETQSYVGLLWCQPSEVISKYAEMYSGSRNAGQSSLFLCIRNFARYVFQCANVYRSGWIEAAEVVMDEVGITDRTGDSVIDICIDYLL